MLIAPHKYPFAINDDGKPIYIGEVTRENRRHTHYRCYGCGAELFPVLGDKREHHFRHEKDAICDPNKYLHEYAKAAIKRRFEESDKFEVTYEAARKCRLRNSCELADKFGFPECEADGLYTIDLKRYYDTCTEEEGYYKELPGGKKKYIADLYLSNSQEPNKPPVCIEVWVTHECTEEKKINGGHIIEIKINKEEDAQRPIAESKDKNLPIRFYGFKRYITLEPSREFLHLKEKDNLRCRETSVCGEGIQYDNKASNELIISDSRLSEEDQYRLYVSYLAAKGNKEEPSAYTCAFSTIWENRVSKKIKCWYGQKYKKCPCDSYYVSKEKSKTYLEAVYAKTPFWCLEDIKFEKKYRKIKNVKHIYR